MQLQPVSTRQDSVTEKQLHFPVLKVGRGACFRPGFHSHTVISVYPAKLPTLLRAYQKTPGRHWANPLPGHTSGGATMGHKQPGKALIHQPVQVDGHWGGMQPGCPGVPQSVGTGPFLTAPHSGAQPDFLPPGARRGQSPAPRVWLLPLCRPWPLAGAPWPGGPHRRCPQLGPHRAKGSRKGGWGWGAAPSPGCPASLPGSSPSGSRPSLAAVGDLPCLGGSEGAAAGENAPAPPAAEGGKGKGDRGAPPESRSPPPACRSPGWACCGEESQHQPDRGYPGRLPSTRPPRPARPPPPPARQAAPEEGKKGPIPPPQTRGGCGRLRAAEPRAAPPAGSAGRGGGRGRGRAGRVRPQAAAVRRLPAAHLSGEGGRGAGERPPLLPAPQLCPGRTFWGTSQAESAFGAARPPSRRPPRPPGRRPLRSPEASPAHGGTPGLRERGLPTHPPSQSCGFPLLISLPSVRVFPQFCQIFTSVLSDLSLSSDFHPSSTPTPPNAAFPLSVRASGHEGRTLLKNHHPSSLWGGWGWLHQGFGWLWQCWLPEFTSPPQPLCQPSSHGSP